MTGDGPYLSAPSLSAAENSARHIAFFVSSHGFGHATRASAVMAAVHALDPNITFHIFSAAPVFVFQDSLTGPFVYHEAVTDIGLVQHSALVEDIPATVARLDEFLPFDAFLLRSWADWLGRLDCELVVCDIAPLGLAVAELAGLPAVLIENFTWDWIYRAYQAQAPELERHADYLAGVFATARYRLQAEPFCVPAKLADARLHPIGRRSRADVAATRSKLNLLTGERLVLITLGGVPDQAPLPTGRLPEAGVVYALAGAGDTLRRDGPWLRLPHHSPIYYPDLLAASDAVIAKLGYSTVAEAYLADAPLGYLPRAGFPESPILAAWAQREMAASEVSTEAFLAGDWLGAAEALLQRKPQRRHRPNGAERAAQFLLDLL